MSDQSTTALDKLIDLWREETTPVVSEIHELLSYGLFDVTHKELHLIDDADILAVPISSSNPTKTTFRVLTDDFCKFIKLTGGHKTAKVIKRIKRLLGPALNIKRFILVSVKHIPAKDGRPSGKIYTIDKDGERLKLGVFPHKDEALSPVDGVIFAHYHERGGERVGFAKIFDMKVWESAEYTDLTLDGSAKGHVVMVPEPLWYNVDVLVFDPKDEIKMRPETDEIFMGIGNIMHADEATIDIITAVNFLSHRPDIIYENGKKALFEVAKRVPDPNASEEELMETVDNMSEFYPVLRRILEFVKEKELPVFPFMLSFPNNDVESSIRELLGHRSRGSIKIPVGGFCCYPKVDIFHVIDNGVIDALDDKYGKFVVVTPHIDEVKDAIAFRQPNSRGEFFEVTLIPTHHVPGFAGMSSNSSVGFMSAKGIVEMFEVLGDGDQDDRITFVTDNHIIEAWNKDKPSYIKLNVNEVSCAMFDPDDITGSFVEYVAMRHRMTFNMGFATNAVLAARLLLDDPNISCKIRPPIMRILKQVVGIPLSQTLDFIQAAGVGPATDNISNIIDAFYDKAVEIPAIFMANTLANRFERNIFRNNSRTRFQNIDSDGRTKCWSIMDRFSTGMLELFKLGNALRCKINMLTWRARRTVVRDIIDIVKTAKTVRPYIPTANSPDAGGEIVGNIYVKDDKFFANITDDGIMLMNRMRAFSFEVSNMALNNRVPLIEDKEKALSIRLTNIISRVSEKWHETAVEIGENLIEKGLERRVRPGIRDIFLDVITPIIADMNEELDIDDDFILISRVLIEAMALQYRERPQGSGNIRVINPDSINTVGNPADIIRDISPKERYHVYMNNIIMSFSDKLVGNLMTLLIGVKRAGSLVDFIDIMIAKDNTLWRDFFKEPYDDVKDEDVNEIDTDK